MAQRWFREDEAPVRIFCRFPDCYKTYYLVAASVPECCPECSRQSNGVMDWWTIERPEGKPTNGVVSQNDRRFLKSIRIEPWEGWIDT